MKKENVFETFEVIFYYVSFKKAKKSYDECIGMF